ncbi:MAG: ABC transporter permease [Thermoanaerobaculia bacterium]
MTELIVLAFQAVVAHRLRTFLSMIGIAIGVTSVVLLTSIGEGTRLYIVNQFSQFGTNLLAIAPGKAETLGIPGALGGTTHKLTIDDAEAIAKLPRVEATMPICFGTARVEAGNRGRSVFVYGVTPSAPIIWQWGVRVGSYWPSSDPRRRASMAVLGPKLKNELFDDQNPLGKFVRIGGTRFRVVGLMEPKGQLLGFDLDDSAYIPVASALKIFNTDEVNEIDVLFSHSSMVDTVIADIRSLLTERHRGKEDFTITSQAAMLDVFGNVMQVITASVSAIAAISLLVGAIGILTMMWISVGERTHEIGLIRSLGATRRQVQWLFLTEAAIISTLGGLAGLAFGLAVCALLRQAIPGLPIQTPTVYAVAAVVFSLATGIISGVAPANRAAALEPVTALRAE